MSWSATPLAEGLEMRVQMAGVCVPQTAHRWAASDGARRLVAVKNSACVGTCELLLVAFFCCGGCTACFAQL